MNGRRLLILSLLLAAAQGCTHRVRETDLFFPRRSAPLPGTAQRISLEIPLPEGGALRGWFLKQAENRPTVIYFYGNGEQLSSCYGRLAAFSKRHAVNVLCMDYRGYGNSDGQPGLHILTEDAVRIWDATVNLRQGSPTVVYGFSIGTVAAIHLASQRPAAGLLLQAPISSPQDVIPSWRSLAPWYVRPFLRVRPSQELLTMSPLPIEEMPLVKTPLLVLHGTADEIIPMASGRKVFQAAGSAQKQWCEVPGAHHNDLDLAALPAQPAITAFLERTSTTP